eukprot:3607678-Rhodomonas_salina.1
MVSTGQLRPTRVADFVADTARIRSRYHRQLGSRTRVCEEAFVGGAHPPVVLVPPYRKNQFRTRRSSIASVSTTHLVASA